MLGLFYCTTAVVSRKVGPVNWLTTTRWVAVLTLTDRPRPKVCTHSYNWTIWLRLLVCSFLIFMPPAWKVRRGHLVIGSSICPVRPFVCPSVCLSVNSVPLTNKVQYLKFGWWYSNQTWTVSSYIWVPYTSLTSRAPGDGAWSKCRT